MWLTKYHATILTSIFWIIFFLKIKTNKTGSVSKWLKKKRRKESIHLKKLTVYRLQKKKTVSVTTRCLIVLWITSLCSMDSTMAATTIPLDVQVHKVSLKINVNQPNIFIHTIISAALPSKQKVKPTYPFLHHSIESSTIDPIFNSIGVYIYY